MAKQAKTILKRCIEDIETTHWCKSDLHTVRDGKRMGCALGLLSLHGEHGSHVGDRAWFVPVCPSSEVPKKAKRGWKLTPASPGLARAVRAVYEALPKSRQVLSFGGDDPGVLDLLSMESRIIDYNDSRNTSRAKVATLFRKALESLEAAPKQKKGKR